MKTYDFLFYKIYNWLVNRNGLDDYPGITSVLFLMGLGALNSYLLLIIFKIILNSVFSFQFSLMSRFEMLVIGLIVFSLLYYRYIYKQKHLKIIALFEKEGIEKQKRNLLKSIFFILLSILLPILIGKTFNTIL